jgi:hypothetical protein
LATAERSWQVLAWEANARIAMAQLDLDRARDCIAKGLSTMEGFEVPLAAWRSSRKPPPSFIEVATTASRITIAN